MALAQTTLNGAVSATTPTVRLTAYTAPATGSIAPQKILRVDGEWMLIADDSNAPTLSVVRGYDGTAGVAHGTLATAAYGLTSDATPLKLVTHGNVTSYGADGAITVPVTPSNMEVLAFITKATAAALTLGAPRLDQDGLMLVVTSVTGVAHVVTATGLYSTGAATVNVATFAAFKGCSMTLQAARGLWNVISSNVVTFT